MWISVETITPDQALTMLSMQPEGWLAQFDQRNRKAEVYATLMKTGQWQPATPVIIDWRGRLIDGYARLRAIIIAGEPVRVPVIRDTSLTRQDVDMEPGEECISPV
jgi:hypothetical protein